MTLKDLQAAINQVKRFDEAGGGSLVFFSFNQLLKVSLGMRPMSKIESFSLEAPQGWLGDLTFFSGLKWGKHLGASWVLLGWRFLKIYKFSARPFADGVDVAGLKDSFDEKVAS